MAMCVTARLFNGKITQLAELPSACEAEDRLVMTLSLAVPHGPPGGHTDGQVVAPEP